MSKDAIRDLIDEVEDLQGKSFERHKMMTSQQAREMLDKISDTVDLLVFLLEETKKMQGWLCRYPVLCIKSLWSMAILIRYADYENTSLKKSYDH